MNCVFCSKRLNKITAHGYNCLNCVGNPFFYAEDESDVTLQPWATFEFYVEELDTNFTVDYDFLNYEADFQSLQPRKIGHREEMFWISFYNCRMPKATALEIQNTLHKILKLKAFL